MLSSSFLSSDVIWLTPNEYPFCIEDLEILIAYLLGGLVLQAASPASNILWEKSRMSMPAVCASLSQVDLSISVHVGDLNTSVSDIMADARSPAIFSSGSSPALRVHLRYDGRRTPDRLIPEIYRAQRLQPSPVCDDLLISQTSALSMPSTAWFISLWSTSITFLRFILSSLLRK